jgi:hypothetical protein
MDPRQTEDDLRREIWTHLAELLEFGLAAVCGHIVKDHRTESIEEDVAALGQRQVQIVGRDSPFWIVGDEFPEVQVLDKGYGVE